GDDLRSQLDPPGAVRGRLESVQDPRLTPIRDRGDRDIEQLGGGPRAIAAIRPTARGAGRRAFGTATRDGITIPDLLYHVVRKPAPGPGAESLPIEDLGDPTIGGIGRQGAQSRHGDGVGPPDVAGAPGTWDAHHGAGFRLPPDGGRDRRL